MCGFAGIARLDGGAVDADMLSRMTRSIAHRGPDGEAFHREAGIGLGFRRLSIIDLSPEAMQPLANEDESVWGVCNGEIYNFEALKRDLAAKGHRFRSHTDVEVLVHLYEELGPEFVTKLRGMFAFAIWDAKLRRLVLGRDRLGIKPLFVYEGKDEVRFGSEIKALLACGDIPKDVDIGALDGYLAQNYVAAPATLLARVRQIEPGEIAILSERENRRVRYWEPRFDGPRSRLSPTEWIDKLEAKLDETVRSHLVADVPLGAFLSGGIDSTSLVALVARARREPTLTFTAEFEEASFGEGSAARASAEALGVSNSQVLFGAPTLEMLRQVVHFSEEPTADLAMPAFYAVCGLARRHVTVAMSGEGADEVFAGYETYVASRLARQYQRVPSAARSLVRRAIEWFPDAETKIPFRAKLKRFVRGADVEGEGAHFAWRRICDPELRQALLVDAAPAVREPHGADVFDRATSDDALERNLFADLCYLLPNELLVKADRMSMAHGLEVRVPFLDHELVDLATSIPPELKLRRGFERKWILREVSKRILPPTLRIPRGKKGFNAPMAAWFRGPLREALGDMLSPSRMRRLGLLKPRVVDALLSEHLRGEHDRSFELYGLLLLSLWGDEVLFSPSAKGAPHPFTNGTHASVQ